MDDIGIAANCVTQLIRNIRAVFECIRQAGLKPSIDNCHFGVTVFEFLGRTITPQGTALQDHKIQKFLVNVRFPKSKKQVQRYFGFVNYCRNYIPRLSEKLLGFYKLVKADRQIKVTEELLDNYKSNQRSISGSLRIRPQATNHRTPISPNDGRYLSRLRICAND